MTRVLGIINAVFKDGGKLVELFKGDEVPDKYLDRPELQNALEPLPEEEPDEDAVTGGQSEEPVPPAGPPGGDRPTMKELRQRGAPFGMRFRPGTSIDDAHAQVTAAEAYDANDVPALTDAANSRDLTVEGTGADGAVVKADLIRALMAADAAQQS